MSIGATLAAARRRAGLTVHDVSQSTRVTEPIIDGIEHDDYAECGGDFYARGHIRAIARAVGEDPGPLIEEFDSTWRSAKETTAAEAFRPSMPIRPGVIPYRTNLSGSTLSAFCAISSLLPGTLPMGGDAQDELLIHCLDVGQPVAADLAREELLFSQVLEGLPSHD